MDTPFLRFLLSIPFQPLPFLCLLVIAAWALRKFGYPRASHLATGCAALWFYLITTAAFPNWAVAGLERRHPVQLQPVAAQLPAGDTLYITVLGAGHKREPELPGVDRLHAAALARLSEGIRLHRLLPGSRLVFTGYGGRDPLSTAEAYRNAALELGVDPCVITVLPEPTNTREEALAFTRRFGPQRHMYLVTDAVHLPRAMHWFGEAGQSPVPAPANHQGQSEALTWRDWLVPHSGNIRRMEVVVHEWLGLVWAWWRA
jgi:uncharacterized SAM-binding protein YcdF (DUF218 family)